MNNVHEFNEGVVRLAKPNMALMPPISELEAAHVYTYLANNQGRHSWMAVSKEEHLNRLMQHLNAYKLGQLDDVDSGRNHMAHVLACASFIIAQDYEEEYERNV